MEAKRKAGRNRSEPMSRPLARLSRPVRLVSRVTTGTSRAMSRPDPGHRGCRDDSPLCPLRPCAFLGPPATAATPTATATKPEKR